MHCEMFSCAVRRSIGQNNVPETLPLLSSRAAEMTSKLKLLVVACKGEFDLFRKYAYLFDYPELYD